jgi:hypothetical protein
LAPADPAPKSPTGDEPRNEQQEALFKSAMSFLDGVFGSASKPSGTFGAAPTFGTTSTPAFGTTSTPAFGASSGFGAPTKPVESNASKPGGGFAAFAAAKPGEPKITGGFAGFGDAAKSKGGFLGFGDNAKKDIFAESSKSEENKEEEEKKEKKEEKKETEQETEQEKAPKKVEFLADG